MTDAAGRHTYTYDAANRLTNVDGITYNWDMRGNLIHDGVYTYTYDTAGRMVQAESLTATLVYTYTSAALSASNGDGLLVTQGTSATVSTFTWDLALCLPQVLGTSDSRHLYGYGRIGVRQDDAWHYPLPDVLGSAHQWTDGTGSLDYAAGYTPFGEPMWQQGSAPAPWGYTGEHWDANVGLLYLRARWYDPTVGRFTQADRIVPNPLNSQAWNRYAYGLNNPLRYTDPSGYFPLLAIGLIGGLVNLGADYLITVHLQHEEYSAKQAGAAFGIGVAGGVLGALVVPVVGAGIGGLAATGAAGLGIAGSEAIGGVVNVAAQMALSGVLNAGLNSTQRVLQRSATTGCNVTLQMIKDDLRMNAERDVIIGAGASFLGQTLDHLIEVNFPNLSLHWLEYNENTGRVIDRKIRREIIRGILHTGALIVPDASLLDFLETLLPPFWLALLPWTR
jgi:RHS repeat-associated protein